MSGPSPRSPMNVDGLPLEDVKRLLRLAELDIDRLRGCPASVPGFTVTSIGDVAFHTGRPRYRVVCDACGEEVHPGTTGPKEMARHHSCAGTARGGR